MDNTAENKHVTQEYETVLSTTLQCVLTVF